MLIIVFLIGSVQYFHERNIYMYNIRYVNNIIIQVIKLETTKEAIVAVAGWSVAFITGPTT